MDENIGIWIGNLTNPNEKTIESEKYAHLIEEEGNSLVLVLKAKDTIIQLKDLQT